MDGGPQPGPRGRPIRFSTTDCGPCPLKARCTRSAQRVLTPRRRDAYAAPAAARARETMPEFTRLYHRRAGNEGTLSQGVRAFGRRCSRYVGQAKTHRQHVVTATALNLVRLGAWLGGAPLARTRQSAYARLMAAVAWRIHQQCRTWSKISRGSGTPAGRLADQPSQAPDQRLRRERPCRTIQRPVPTLVTVERKLPDRRASTGRTGVCPRGA